MSDDQKIDGHAIKELSRETGRPITTLLALSSCNDPFYAGATPASMADAEWFAELYHRFGFGRGSHLRRVHYRIVSQETPVIRPDGKPYENTEACWQKLIAASKPARYLGLVPIDDFDDKRNPDPTICLPPPALDPSIDTFQAELDLDVPESLPTPDLYFYVPHPTPFHIEIWCEKSTINDVLDPLARRYGLNIQTGLGELSVSKCRDLVTRVLANGGRPVRVFYISDFDPGGQSMPVAVARKVEWLLRQLDGVPDLKLQPIALTHAQCTEYELPRTPLKETEARAAAFETRYGEGATELDALEALHPGVLREIIIKEIERFLDPTLPRRLFAVEREIERQLSEITEETLAEHGDERAALQSRLDALRSDAKRLRSDQAKINRAIRAAMMARARPIIDDLEIPEPRDADEWEEPLFDSARDYVEQIDAYKQFQGKPTSRKGRRSRDL